MIGLVSWVPVGQERHGGIGCVSPFQVTGVGQPRGVQK